MRKLHFILALIIIGSAKLYSQNMGMPGLLKIYIYRTQEDFFKGKKDSIMGPVDYDYGKVKYKDPKSGKKVKYHLLRDSAFFAIKLNPGYRMPIYASCKGEKTYGVFFGGNENLFMIFYSRGNMNTSYDKDMYASYFNGTYDQFGYYCRFVKKGFDDKKQGTSIDSFIKDDQQLFNKYMEEYKGTSKDTWNRVFIEVQLKYLKKYNKVIK